MSEVSISPPLPTYKTSALVNLGGMIGIAASLVGLGVFIAGCAGMARAFDLAVIPLCGSAAGIVLTVLGGVFQRGGVERTGVVASLFVNVFALVGGLLEFAMWNGATIFPSGVAQ